MIFLRSLAFALAQILVTPPYAIVALATFPLPRLVRFRIIAGWSYTMVWLAKTVLGIDYRVIGRENLPRTPTVILSKHQSAWETLAFQVIFPPQVWVVKRELLWLPLFGWGLAMLAPIAIDRGSGARALRQMLEQGRDRLAQGFCIVIFPEGTRVAPGEHREYHAGGAWLAAQCAVPVLPVAHDAGSVWQRNAFLKRPGTVTVSVGEPIVPQDLTPQEITARVEAWVEGEVRRLEAERAARAR